MSPLEHNGREAPSKSCHAVVRTTGRNRLHRLPMLALLASSLMSPAPAQAQATLAGISGDVAVSNVLDGAKNDADEVINRLSDKISSNSFQIRAQMQILINDINAMLKSEQGKLFKQLTSQQQQLVINIRQITHTTMEDVNKSLAHLDDVVDNINTVVGDLPFGSKEPRISRVAPAFVLTQSSNMSTEFSARGAFLDFGSPNITVSGTHCTTKTQIDNRLVFSCPSTAFKSGNNVAYKTIALRLMKSETLWEDLRSFFGYKRPTKLYKIGVGIIPSTMGQYVAYAVVSTENHEARQRREMFSHHNGHCQPHTSHTANFSASKGWSIVQPSIHVEKTYGSGGYNAPTNVTSAGFQINYYVNNGGFCGPKVAGTHLGLDGRGYYSAWAVWTEERSVVKHKTVQVKKGVLRWGDDVKVHLPDKTQSTNVSVTLINGEQQQTIGSEDRQWYDINVGPRMRVLVIQPKSLANALSAAAK